MKVYPTSERIAELLARFRTGNRIEAWRQAAALLPPDPRLQYRIKKFIKFVGKYEALRRRWEATPDPYPVSTPHAPRKSRPGGTGGLYNPNLKQVGGRLVNKAGKPLGKGFHWNERLNRFTPIPLKGGLRWRKVRAVRISWEDKPPGSFQRRARMLGAWLSRRRRVDERLLATIHPHIRKTLGDRALLIRLGRLSPTVEKNGTGSIQ